MAGLPPDADPERGADDSPPHWAAVVNLYLDTRTEARRAAAWILGSLLDPEIEDVIHDGIVKAALNFHTLRKPECARSWFLKIVVCQACDRRRVRSRKESPAGSAGDLEQLGCALSCGVSPEEFPLLRAGLDFMNTLPEKQRVTYLLKHFFGFNREDIAEVLGCSPRTVNTHLRRAQAKVDKKFSPAADRAMEAQRAQSRRRTA